MKKQYIFILLFVSHLIMGQTPTGNSTEVGITEGQLSVSLTGGATYSIPIAVPPGINGVVPQVSLTYNSQAGNGQAGYGWNISGVSAITRIPSDKFHDGVIDAVDFDALDRFAFEGQRLVIKSGTSGVYGANGTIYETEGFSNVKITSYGVHPSGANYGPAYFIAEYPDGSKSYYGNSADSRSITDWAITYWENPQSVRISYSYALANNSLRIAKISYGGNGANPAINEIQFGYKIRQRPEQVFIGGQSLITDTLLFEIRTIGNGIGFRNYVLTHLPEDITSLGYERLSKITESSGDSTKSYNPTVFKYDTTNNDILFDAYPSTQTNLSNVNYTNSASISGDFNGDGTADIVIYPTTGFSAKKEFSLFDNLNNTTINFATKVPSGPFDEIFSSSWLSADNKLMPLQGITAVQFSSISKMNFNTFARDSNGVFINYTKEIEFPTQAVNQDLTYNFCGFSDQRQIPKQYLNGDFNGDGLTDVIAIEKSTSFYTYTCNCCDILGNFYTGTNPTPIPYTGGKSYFVDLDRRLNLTSAVSSGNVAITSTSKLIVADFNGDGKSDIYLFDTGIVKIYTLNDSKQLVLLFSQSDTGIKLDKPLLMGDYNGDGKIDFVIPQIVNSDSWNFYFSNGNNSFILKNGTIGNVYREVVCNYTVKFSESNYLSADFNLDGKTDILYFNNRTTIDTSAGTNHICDSSFNGAPLYTQLALYENKTANPNQINFVGNFNTFGTNYGLKRFPLVAILDHNNRMNTAEFSLFSDNQIISFKQPKNSTIDTKLKSITTGNGVIESITYKPLKYEPCPYNCHSVYLESGSIEYYPNTDIVVAPNFQVVSMLEKQSTAVHKKQLFAYYGAVSNVEGLGFLGFRSTMRTNWFEFDSQIISSLSKFDIEQRGANTENYTVLGLQNPLIASSNQTPRIIVKEGDYTITGTENLLATQRITLKPNTWIKAGSTFTAKINQEANASSNTPTDYITKSILTYESELLPNKVFKIQNAASKQYNGLDNTNSETTTVYDTYNNPIKSTTLIKEGTATVQTSVSDLAYVVPTTTPYVVGRPMSKTQSITITGDNTTSEELYAYTNHLLTQIKKKGNNTDYITEDNIYDAFGNITKKTITVPSLTPRVTNYEYDPSGRFLTKSTDIEGLSTTFVYNTNNGILNSETNPYGLTTSYLYDPWFKKTTTTDYLGKNNTYTYSRTNSVETLITNTRDDGSANQEVFDDLGRKYITGIKDITGNISNVYYYYDIYDRNFKVSEPYFGTSPSQFNSTEYDVYGRVTKSTSFTGKIVTMNYSGLSTTVNDGTKTKTSVKNAIGNVVSMTDTPGGTINYTYFANGNLKTTNYDGVVTTIEQDGWGRKIKLTDPSAGTYTYSYNGFGETTSETTPNGTTTYTLNAVGKLTAKTISGINTNSSTVYNYNSTTKLLDSSIFTNTLEGGDVTTNTYSYDSSKRLVGTTEVTPYATFSKTIDTFDAFGRVETENTSGTINGKTSSITIKNTYKNGYPWQILDNTTQQVLWQTNTVNERGQLTNANRGRETITNTYDQYGFVTQFKHDWSFHGVSTNIMTLNTVFDPQKGNLTSRTNSMFNWNESFAYDSLDRLTSYKNAQGAIETQYYDNRGRITQNNLGTYNYNNNAKAYQNTSVTVTPEAKAYYLTKPLQTVSYNAFKSPVEITEQGGVDRISFTYNDNNDRSTMFYGSLDVDKNLRPNRKYYSADGSMEIKQNILTGVTEFVTYIGGDGYSAPIVLKSDGTTQNYLYLHRDYQGSILAITDANATVLEKRLFDAWGSLISIQNGSSQPIANGQWLLDRGYTGHEHLLSVGLINMNGRIYDPKLHRFLQPDNFVQDPMNTQNYNRYGYCWNNPTKFTDPSGEWINIVIGAVIGGAIAAINGGNFGDILKGVIVGAIAGLVGGGIGNLAAGGTFFGSAVTVAGFGAGAFAGAAGGLAGAFAGAATSSWLDGGSLNDGLNAGTMAAPIGIATGGLFGGVSGGLKALEGDANFWTGNQTLDTSKGVGAHTEQAKDLVALGKVRAKYKGKFESANVYEPVNSSLLGSGDGSGGITLPPKTIIVGNGAYELLKQKNAKVLDLFCHEFGHILQARKVGLDAFYHIIAVESLASSFGSREFANNYWTETWANSLSQDYFKRFFNSIIKYPAAPLSDYGRIRLLLYTLHPVSGTLNN